MPEPTPIHPESEDNPSQSAAKKIRRGPAVRRLN